MNRKKSSFSSSLGFILSAAGSAVGVGNIWRFPYLAAKDGGGLFILLYCILVVTFGFTLLTTDIAIGRKTKENALHAFNKLSPKWGFLGKITFAVPAIIMTYYSVIGAWVIKYMFEYLYSGTEKVSKEGYFGDFITSKISPIIFMLIFLFITSLIVFNGVEKGIERFSSIVMPGLIIMIAVIAVFSLTLRHTDELGNVRTGIEGFKIYIIPDLEGMTIKRFLSILLDAMSQLFFSLSVSMGIMITYGSYVKKDVNLSSSISRIEIFDTVVAILAGVMIVPAVYVFYGKEGMSSGPGLMFVSLPKVFDSMGVLGKYIGFLFFLMVAFAALTSCISILETLVANCMEVFKSDRKKVCLCISILSALSSVIICLGYNILYFELKLPNGQIGQILDLVDYVSNSLLMPFISMLTCIFIGHVIGPKVIVDEMEVSGHKFKRKTLYIFMLRYVTPVLMGILFLQSTGILGKIGM